MAVFAYVSNGCLDIQGFYITLWALGWSRLTMKYLKPVEELLATQT